MNDLGVLIEVGFLIVLAGFLADWLCVFFGWKKFRPYAKVLAMAILILWTFCLFRFNPGRLGFLLILALIFGLLGDFLLLFPDRCFKWGLGAFLLGHLTYLFLFTVLIRLGLSKGIVAPITIWVWAILVVIILAAMTTFNRVIIRKMREPRPWWGFQVALYLYAACLTLVMAIGWLTAGMFAPQGGWIWAVGVGGTLFIISDFTLAYDRFVQRFKSAHIIIMVSYHLAQFSLAVGLFTLISIF